MNALALTGTVPVAAVNVTVKLHGLVGGTGNLPVSGTSGPTVVASTVPWRRCTETLSPWIASRGCSLLAWSDPSDWHLRLRQPARELAVLAGGRGTVASPGLEPRGRDGDDGDHDACDCE